MLNELMPLSSPGGAWTPVLLHNFTRQQGDGYQPAELMATPRGGEARYREQQIRAVVKKAQKLRLQVTMPDAA